MTRRYVPKDRCNHVISIAGMMIIIILILPAVNSGSVAYGQEVPPDVKNMALITTQFRDPYHNKNLFDAQQAVASFNGIYELNSHGKVSWNVTITPTWYTLPKAFQFYDVSCKLDRGDYFVSTYDFILDSLRSASKDIDLTEFDYVMIIYPRYDSTLDHSCTIPTRSWVVDEREYRFGVSIVRESESYSWLNDNLWVMVREANSFLGLPYLYGANDAQVPAAWDVMGWEEGMHNSTLIGGFSKATLGWIEDDHIKTVGYGEKETVTLDPLGTKSSKISLIKIPITTENYYLLETRVRVGGDANLPPDVTPGVIISEVDESSGEATVTWISNASPDNPNIPKQVQDIAFVEGTSFSNKFIGSIKVVSKTQNSYTVEIDREFTYPGVVDGKYDYNGLTYNLPEGWKSVAVGWDILSAKDNPLIGFGKLRDVAISTSIIDPKAGLEAYTSNPLLADVQCNPTYQGYLEVNNLIAKKVNLRCLSNSDASDSKAPVAMSYYFGYSQPKQGTEKSEDRLLSFTLIAESPGLLESGLAEFEKTVNSVQVRNSKDVRIVENEAIGLNEQIQSVTFSNSTLEIPLYSNVAISNLKFDVENNMITFKVQPRDSNGITRLPYDTFLKGPYWIRVDGITSDSFLIVEDGVSGQQFVELRHHSGINDIVVVGMSSDVIIPLPVEQVQIGLKESEKPVEIIFRQPTSELPIKFSVVWSRLAQLEWHAI